MDAPDVFSFLHYTWPHHDAWDVARLLTSCVMAILILFYLRLVFRKNGGGPHTSTVEEQKAAAVGCAAILAVLVPSMLTNLEQVGNDVYPWRLPFYVATVALCIQHIRLRL